MLFWTLCSIQILKGFTTSTWPRNCNTKSQIKWSLCAASHAGHTPFFWTLRYAQMFTYWKIEASSPQDNISVSYQLPATWCYAEVLFQLMCQGFRAKRAICNGGITAGKECWLRPPAVRLWKRATGSWKRNTLPIQQLGVFYNRGVAWNSTGVAWNV